MEGPSLVILKEELQPFKGKKILSVGGNTTEDKKRLKNKTIRYIKTWGKHLILVFDRFAVRVHFLMFGSYRINERKEGRKARLCFKLKNGEINFYTCSVKFIEGDLNEVYDWKADVMSDEWDEKLALKRVKENPEEKICDVLLDQDIFAGVGNIMKNEILYNTRIHPETKVKKLTDDEIKAVTAEARAYSFVFYGWKKIYSLRKHWKVYKQKTCGEEKHKVIQVKTGKRNRRSFICPVCQVKK